MSLNIGGEDSPPEDKEHLRVPPNPYGTSPRWSTLSTSSTACTVVEKNPDYEEEFTPNPRTHIAVPQLSWWDCFRGFLFGPRRIINKLAATIDIMELGDEDEKMFDHKVHCPFFITVSVFPCPTSNIHGRQSGRCVLDTACMQGNIISADFARRLGYTSFLPLKEREENGGTVITGDLHQVSGAIHVSWYHSTSAKVYRDMRFLVSDTAQVDLVIGTHSIVRHSLMSPPNLVTWVPDRPDPNRDQLLGKRRDLEKKIWDENTPGEEKNGLRNELEIVRLQLKLLQSKSRLSRETNPIFRAVHQRDIDEYTKQLKSKGVQVKSDTKKPTTPEGHWWNHFHPHNPFGPAGGQAGVIIH